jgi:pilus assembly protein CpaB
MAAAAIVLALVAGIGVYMYAAGADKRAQDNASFVDALVANSDIAKGTTGNEIIQAGLVNKEKVAKSSLPPSIITNMDDLVGKVAAGPLNAKQFVTSAAFVSEEDGTGSAFANTIKSQDLVAVTVTVDADRGVANQIAPGDHVNIASKPVNGDGTPGQYEYILTHVKVLAVGASTAAQQATAASSSDDASASAPTNSGVLTFEVTKDQALQVINANNVGGGQIYLVLLAPDTPAPSSGAAKAAASGK